jgi:hypothetical protein
MVQVWTKPTTVSLLVAGLPQFSILSAIASGIRDETLLRTPSNSHVEADVVSPYGSSLTCTSRTHARTLPLFMH